MKLIIECRSLIKPPTGVGLFTKDLINALSQTNSDWEIYLLTPTNFHLSIEINKSSNIHIINAPISWWRLAPRIIWYLLKVPILVRKIKPDVFLSPMSYFPFGLPRRVKTVNIIHDVVNIEFKETMTLANRIYNLLLFNKSVNNSDYIWCTSNYTKERISHYFPTRKCKNIFVGLSIDAAFQKKKISADRKLLLSKNFKIVEPFILFVGSLEPRKNLEFLLKLTPILYERHKIKTIIIGAKGWKNSSIYKIISDPSYPKEATHFGGYIATFELVELYNLASCYVSTSLNEGFGMPQLEALFCGCPVVTANNSGMTEVVSGRGTLVDGWDEEEWIRKIIEAVKTGRDPETNLDLTEYDWANITYKFRQYLNL